MILKLWCKGTNKRECYNGINAESLTMEQKKYKQINTKTPEIQEMILSYQIGGVTYELAQRLNIPLAQALDMFYRSKTCAQLHDKRTGLYLMSNGYIADDFIMEMQRGQSS